MSENQEFTHVYTSEKLGWNVKAVKVDNSVTVIKKQAFEFCCNLTTIEMHNNITEIERYAFCQCDNLQAITIPSSVKTIDEWAFSNCSQLETVNVSPSTKICSSSFYNNCNSLSDESKSRISIIRNNLTLSENFQKGDGPTLDFQGATQNGYGPEMWGLTLKQIKLIRNHRSIKSDTIMRQVVELAVKSTTKGLGIGYALLVNQDKPLRAKVMVSVSYFTNDNAHFKIY